MCGDQRSIGRDSVLGTRWIALVLLTLALALASPVAASAAEATGQIAGKVTNTAGALKIGAVIICDLEL